MSLEPLADSASDDNLLPRIASGDTAAFAALFRRCHAKVYRFALHMTGAPTAAEDITQDVFLAVMRDAARYQPGRSGVTAWLCGIARNHALRRLERDQNIVPLTQVEGEAQAAAGGPHPLDTIARAEQVDTLRRAVLALPVRYREAVVLCDLQELSYEEAAAALACAVGTVRSRLHRGRALLAAKMRAERPPAKTVTRCLA